MLRLQLLDKLQSFSGERSICTYVRAHCRRRRVLSNSRGTSLKHAGYEVAAYASARHLLDRLPSVVGCIPLDVRIPGMSGPELQERLSELGSTLPIIFLTGYPDVRTTVRTIKAGAEDFLTKPVSSDKLLQGVERAIAHHTATYRLKSTLDVVRSRISMSTPRERQVFELVVRGNTNKQIARAIGGTEPTIKAHRHRVMEKMQVTSLAELVSLAERVGVFASAAGRHPRHLQPAGAAVRGPQSAAAPRCIGLLLFGAATSP